MTMKDVELTLHSTKAAQLSVKVNADQIKHLTQEMPINISKNRKDIKTCLFTDRIEHPVTFKFKDKVMAQSYEAKLTVLRDGNQILIQK